MNQNQPVQHYPKYLWFLVLSFSMVVAISNWYDARLINLFSITVTPGSLLFPATFLLSDIITDVYGYKHARRAIWVALFFNVIFILYGKILTLMPSPDFPNNNEALDKLINMNFWIIVASFISYIVAEPLNSYLVAKLKIKMQGKYTGFRFIASTIIASSIDTPLFVLIAFHKTLTFETMSTMIVSVWFIKCLVEIGLLPFSIKLTQIIKDKEKINIYDINTDFAPFSIDVTYSAENNKYEGLS
ncbi:queuosine precursor transporter [Legionella sp. CNM-4043-24]|uniref:queuosine precursor transporter n=1 Tax=Legionella sp. CNM-4043-24 TaxID=3421646 RepID=UPI00403B143A